jgi:hypothetical protein
MGQTCEGQRKHQRGGLADALDLKQAKTLLDELQG